MFMKREEKEIEDCSDQGEESPQRALPTDSVKDLGGI